MKHGVPYFVSFAATFAAAAAGSVASIRAPDFYRSLEKPSWAPPPAVFGPVWTVLYILMALAAAIVWMAVGFKAAKTSLTLFGLQLVLNALWTWVFFAWRSGLWAMVDIVVLWFVVAILTVLFWKIRWVSGLLLLPYLAWVTFATFLTAAVWRANPSLL